MSLSTSLPGGFPAITVEVKRHRFFQAAPATHAAGQAAGSPPALSLASIRCDSPPPGLAPWAKVTETNVLDAIQAGTAALLASICDLKDHLGKVSNTAPIGDIQRVSEKPKRKYVRKLAPPMVEPLDLKERNWLTFKQAAAIYPQSEQAFRRLARQAEQYLKDPKAGLPSNGFERCIVRPSNSRNVFLDAIELDRWMASGRVAGSPEHGHD